MLHHQLQAHQFSRGAGIASWWRWQVLRGTLVELDPPLSEVRHVCQQGVCAWSAASKKMCRALNYVTEAA